MKEFKVRKGLLASLFVTAGILAACGGGEEEASQSKEEKVTVDIFQFKVEFKDQFEDVVELYEKENPDVNIDITTVGGGEDYGAALRSRFASGNEPAIFNIGGPQDVADWKEKLTDLSDTKAAGAALDGTLDGVTVEKEVLGLPYNQEGYGFVYNTRLFEEAGIDPASITDFASLEKAVKTLDSKKEELGLEAVFALPGKEAWVTGLHLSNTFLAPEFNHNVLDTFAADKVEFKYGDAFKKILDLQNDYSAQPSVSLDYSQQVEELFSLERVAIIQQGNWVYGSIAGIDQELADSGVGMMPIPVDGYEEGGLPVGVPMYWGVNSAKDEKVVEASKEFMDWLYTSDAGKKAVVEDFKFIPAYEGYDTSKITDPMSKAIYDASEAGETIGWVFMGYPTGWGEGEVGASIQKYLSDEASWEEVIESAKKAWETNRSK
ncbi:ABC transporter substrate-binding protein [Planococcus sp. N028]|uniref:ABC transporter substrate-binding protein n=1 Tax=Planococcus shixiaomingii TaxID=3058393 RepID=A0ABT8N4T7_9BACL|nr:MULTISPECIES: ABC transporter substrate-binding protein [unclassified Planococcus (in: firmicutes)]MDN7242907.1 ABC transporter substrate-binding protein [Planococcus sp. N028]WKA55468.1 ABC transporter substrate-binding protein [Planococcus sp. N022]